MRVSGSPGTRTSSKPGIGLDDLMYSMNVSTCSKYSSMGMKLLIFMTVKNMAFPILGGFSRLNPAFEIVPVRMSTMSPKPNPLWATIPPNGKSAPGRSAYRSLGFVLGLPFASIIHPSGIDFPRFLATRTFPSATTLVVMSTTRGSPTV